MAQLLNGQPPEFTGFDLIAQPVNKWLKRFNRWIILNNVGIARKREIMESVLDSPALDMYLRAIAAEGDLHEDLIPPVDAAAQIANWGHIETWFRDAFNDEEHQQILRSALPEMAQLKGETPRQFFIRITIALRDAGYQQVVINDLSESMWRNGIHPDVLQHTQGLGHLTFENLMKAADGYWISIIQKQPNYRNQNARELRLKPTQLKYRSKYENQESEEEETEYEQPKQILKRPKDRKVQQQQPQADPAMEKLTKMMEDLQVHVANLQRKSDRPTERFYESPRNRRDQLDPQDRYYQDRRRQEGNDRDNRTCYLCHKEGHFANRCPTRTWQEDKTNSRPQVNTVDNWPGYESDSENDNRWNWQWSAEARRTRTHFQIESEDSEEEVHAYPVGRPPKKENKKPYTRPEKKAPEKSALKKKEPMDIEIDLDAPASESLNENKLRTRNKREYKFDPWKRIEELPVPISLGELSQLSPYFRQAIKNGVSESKPTFQVNSVEKSPAYAVATVQGRPAAAIIDSGAGICIISRTFLIKLGWQIDCASKREIVVADGTKTTAIGEMKDVPVCFGNCTIPVDFTVCNATSYDLILGVNWLKKAQAKIDFEAAMMRISFHGQDEEVPLDLTRGARPTMVDTDSENEGPENEEEESSVNAVTQTKWPKANKPPKEDNSDDEYPTEMQRRKEEERTYLLDEYYEMQEREQEATLYQEFINGPIEEIKNEVRMTFNAYKQFRQYFEPTEKFQTTTKQNREQKRALNEKLEDQKLKDFKRRQEDWHRTTGRLPWQQALRTVRPAHELPYQRQPPRVYSKKDELAWKQKQAWRQYAENQARRIQKLEDERKFLITKKVQQPNPWQNVREEKKPQTWNDNRTEISIDETRELEYEW